MSGDMVLSVVTIAMGVNFGVLAIMIVFVTILMLQQVILSFAPIRPFGKILAVTFLYCYQTKIQFQFQTGCYLWLVILFGQFIKARDVQELRNTVTIPIIPFWSLTVGRKTKQFVLEHALINLTEYLM